VVVVVVVSAGFDHPASAERKRKRNSPISI